MRCGFVVECLPSMHKALGSSPAPQKKKNKIKINYSNIFSLYVLKMYNKILCPFKICSSLFLRNWYYW
jgi:hypothetical protein